MRTHQGEAALEAGIAEKGMLFHLEAGKIGFGFGMPKFRLAKDQDTANGRLGKVHRTLKNGPVKRGPLRYSHTVETGHLLRVGKVGAIGIEFAADLGPPQIHRPGKDGVQKRGALGNLDAVKNGLAGRACKPGPGGIQFAADAGAGEIHGTGKDSLLES